jgi:tetratricopeptide (TPR) repeat protein
VEQLIRLNRAGDYEAVIAKADHLILLAPWIAETWNQRGLAHYHERRFRPALADFCQALELNPYHFDAAIGMAQCHLARDSAALALECCQRALRINPNLEGVRAQIFALRRTLEQPG